VKETHANKQDRPFNARISNSPMAAARDQKGGFLLYWHWHVFGTQLIYFKKSKKPLVVRTRARIV